MSGAHKCPNGGVVRLDKGQLLVVTLPPARDLSQEQDLLVMEVKSASYWFPLRQISPAFTQSEGRDAGLWLPCARCLPAMEAEKGRP